jgi:anti-anti-sigma regulatory factor
MMNGELLLDETANKIAPSMVVLQPNGSLSEVTGTPFKASLGQAIAQADSIVIDLLWIDTIDQAGLSILLSGMTQASKLGKSLSFLSMDQRTRCALDSSWEKLRVADAPAQMDVFAPEFEQFLDLYRTEGIAAN